MARIKSYKEALNEAFFQVMEADPTVIMLGEDIAGGKGSPGDQDAWGGDFGVSKGLIGRFGNDRVLDVPISESAFVGAAVGAAMCGLRPVAELMFVDFIGVCLDQLLNQAAKSRYMFGGKAKTPVVIRTMYGAGLRAASQHSQCLYSIFAHIPGLKCIAPASAYDAKGLFISAVRDNDPVIFMEHKALYNQISDDVPEEMYSIPLGEARIVSEGSDVTIVALGRMVHFSMNVARDLKKQNISCEVIDPRTISPLDEETILESVEKTGRLVIVDESTPICNMATHIAAIVADKAFSHLRAPIRRVTAPHTPPPFAPELEDMFVPSPQRIAEAVRSIA
jgi:pyruvate dehydrogenase E1 component beta subunit